tara:strand:+ start:2623 stop:3816 length:1194 start_codon:yes stop_codon:yes gene_type:complete
MSITKNQISECEDDKLKIAESLIPTLRERAAKGDLMKRLPDETYEDLRLSGLARTLQPKSFGGDELGFVELIDRLTAIGRGDASTGWVLGQYCIHAYMTAFLPEEGQNEVWGEDPECFIVGVLAFPAGNAKKTNGGYILNGRWPFASGIDGAKWCIFGANLEDSNGQLVPWLFHVPINQVQQINNWETSGLRGTGSKDVSLENIFVPESRSLPVELTKEGNAPGLHLNNAPIYKTPMFGCFGFVQGSATLGGAQATIQIFVEKMKKRTTTSSGARLSEFMTLQSKISEAQAAIDAAETILKTDAIRIMQIAKNNEISNIETRLKLRRNAAYAAKLAVNGVDLIISAAGGSALYDKNPLSRSFRDAHACLAHITMNWEANGIPAGRHALGLDPNSDLI